MSNGIKITGVSLYRIGKDAIVSLEIGGRWVEVIRERADANYSHICEEGGIAKALTDADRAKDK
jgi:hypothetical protein